MKILLIIVLVIGKKYHLHAEFVKLLYFQILISQNVLAAQLKNVLLVIILDNVLNAELDIVLINRMEHALETLISVPVIPDQLHHLD